MESGCLSAAFNEGSYSGSWRWARVIAGVLSRERQDSRRQEGDVTTEAELGGVQGRGGGPGVQVAPEAGKGKEASGFAQNLRRHEGYLLTPSSSSSDPRAVQ